MKTALACFASAILGALVALAFSSRNCRDDMVWQNFDAICDRLDDLERAALTR